MKKILFCIIDFNIGGTEKSLINLLYFLPKDYKITLLVLKNQGGFLSEIPDSVNIIEIENSRLINDFLQQSPMLNILQLLKRRQFINFFYAIFNYLRWKLTDDFCYNFKTLSSIIPKIDDCFDIAVAYAGPHDFISYVISNNVIAKKKIQWLHFDVSKIGFNIKTSKKLYNKFDEIRVVSDSVKQRLLAVLPELEKKLTIQYNVVSSPIIKQMSSEKNVFLDDFKGIRIVTVGRLTKEKGHELFIEAIRKLIDNGYSVRWYLVGDGIYKEVLLNKIDQLKLQEDVVFVGSTLNPYTYMGQCDIYLQPSYYEGHCVTILEAKILNKPIVCTRFAGAMEEVNDGVTGLVVDISSEGIYNGIKALLEDRKLSSLFTINLENQNKINQNVMIDF
jgi:glycosyltransferase involved in cell wall biosynthesis